MLVIFKIFTVIGSLGMFLFGMKLMSEGLQKLAGSGLRRILAAITANRYKSFFTGLTLTMLIQSSSATTVMVVSFVNAGLLSLQESIGIILGANLGTTVTAWLVSLLGFNIKISSLTLPLIGIAFPFIFSSNYKRQYIGEFIIGFALIFTGLEFIKSNLPDMTSSSHFFQIISEYSDKGVLSILMFIGIGLVITSIIQSSSAATALTLVMCYKGWINFPLAAAMILGENIGTTITANIAAFVGNKKAKRAAIAHTLINVFGVIWAFLLFKPLVNLTIATVTYFWGASPENTSIFIPIGLSLFHTLFNLINVLILINLTGIIEKIIGKSHILNNENSTLKHISTGLLSTTEISVLQARKEIQIFGVQLSKMFILVKKLFAETNDVTFQKYYSAIKLYENQSDKITTEIISFLTKVSQGEVSKQLSGRIGLMLKTVDKLESIGDVCRSISKILKRRRKHKLWFPQEFRNNLNDLFDLIEKAFSVLNDNLSADYDIVTHARAKEIEKSISKMRKHLQKEHIQKADNADYLYQAGIIYLDIINQTSLLSKEIYSVTESIAEFNGSLLPIHN